MSRKKRPPRGWMPEVGETVNYHALIGGPVTRLCTVKAGPERLGNHTWVVWLWEVRGCVAVEALTRQAVVHS